MITNLQSLSPSDFLRFSDLLLETNSADDLRAIGQEFRRRYAHAINVVANLATELDAADLRRETWSMPASDTTSSDTIALIAPIDPRD